MNAVAVAAEEAIGRMPKKASRLTRQRVRSAWLFMAPMLIVLALVAGWPLLRTIWFSFTDANLSDLSGAEFVGFLNYSTCSRIRTWWNAVWNTLVFAAVSVTVETAAVSASPSRSTRTFAGAGWCARRSSIPWAIPTVVSAQMWKWMLNDQFGVINHVLLAVGLIEEPVAWTASPDTALLAVILVDVWKTTPFMALLLLAGLQMLPQACYEAPGSTACIRWCSSGHPAAAQAGADGRGHLPHARCHPRLRPDLRDDRQRRGHHDDVGLCPPAAGRLPGRRVTARRRRPSCS